MKDAKNGLVARLSAVLFTLVACSGARAQELILQLTNAQGFSNNSVNCLFEDSRHTLWVGTWDGLNAYDGDEVEQYLYSPTPTSISNNVIRQVVEQDDSVVWVATEQGVNRLSLANQSFSHYFPGSENKPLQDDNRCTLGLAADGTLLCLTLRGQLFAYDVRQRDFVAVETTDAHGLQTFVASRDNRLYFLDANGRVSSYKYDGQASRPRLTDRQELAADGPIVKLLTAGGNPVGVETGRIVVWNNGKIVSEVPYPVSKTVADVQLMDGKLYIAYTFGGLQSHDLKTGQDGWLLDGGTRFSLLTLYAGSQNILWAGTDGAGLLQFHRRHADFHTMAMPFTVRCFGEDNRGRLVVGTKGGGLYRAVHGEQPQPLPSPATLPQGSDAVYALARNARGDLFAGTDGDGLLYLAADADAPQQLAVPAGMPSFGHVYAICFDQGDTTVWLGTYGQGLVKATLERTAASYRIAAVKQFTHETHPKLGNDIVFAIAKTKAPHQLLLGTRGAGAILFDTKTEQFANIEDAWHVKLSHQEVNCILPTDDGYWIGTTYGLNHIGENAGRHTLREFTDREGLLSNTIHALCQSSDGSICATTNRGLSLVMPKDRHIINITREMGLQDNEFCDGAAFTDANGCLMVGGVAGYNRIEPGTQMLSHHTATVRLRSFTIDGKTQAGRFKLRNGKDSIATLLLDYGENYLRMEFSIYDFVNNEACQMKYRIRGNGKEWVNNKTNRVIQLSQLPRGTYLLDVVCSNSSLEWNNQPYTLRIEVAGSWWTSPWALLLFLALVAAFAYLTTALWRHHKQSQQLKSIIGELRRQSQTTPAGQTESATEPAKTDPTELQPLRREDKQWLEKLAKYVEENIDSEEITADELASHMLMSRSSLYRKLKELTGKTPGETVKTIRLQHAAHLIKTTRRTITEIMYDSGFSSKSYFYREFTKAYNCSPREFREKKA